VANYENFAIPTNIRVNETVKANFGTFYASLFDKVLAKHPRAVITEYSWNAGSCDPCPEPPLNVGDLATLGVDALPGYEGAKEAPPEIANAFTLTRLHTRYDSNALGEDLVFRAAPGIAGGNGVPDAEGRMTRGAQPSGYSNSFQGRYVMLHPWEGPIECKEPRRGNWGGPVKQIAASPMMVATNTAFAPRGAQLASFLQTNEPEAESAADAKLPSGPVQETPLPPPITRGCASCATVDSRDGFGAVIGAMVAGLAGVLRRRRKVRTT
jgi:MYXO-CTERM domain-containing protein